MDILLVDDDEKLLAALKDAFALGRGDLHVETAATAEEALDRLEQNSARLVISDINLPKKSGLDLLLESRQRWPAIRFILISGYPELLDSEEARDRGALRLLQKPFRIVDLLTLADDTLAAESLKGSLEGISLGDLMQLLHLVGGTASLEVRSGEREGQIYLSRGDVVHAQCVGLAGEELEGMDAFREILSWGSAHFVTHMNRQAEKESVGWGEKAQEGRATRGKILVVDDSRTALHFTRKALEEAGFLVETLDNAWVAPLLSRFRPDLVLMDVELSISINGATAIKAVRDRPFARDVIFLLYSSLPESKLEELAQECGADGWIRKKDSADELLSEVERYLKA